jgi:hypothetical protein
MWAGAGKLCDPAPLTCMVFDPMVHLQIEVTELILGCILKGKILSQKATKSGFIFAEWVNP